MQRVKRDLAARVGEAGSAERATCPTPQGTDPHRQTVNSFACFLHQAASRAPRAGVGEGGGRRGPLAEGIREHSLQPISLFSPPSENASLT